jgi:branched-chain amino acid transport system substrate-binding protein
VQDPDVAAVVGVVNSSVAQGIRDSFDESKKLLIVAGAGSNAVTGASKSNYVWRTSYSTDQLTGPLGTYVASQTKGGSVFVIAADYSAGHEQVGAFQKTFEAAGGKVAGSAYTPFGTTSNYQPYLAQIRQTGATAVFAFYAGSESVAFVKQYQEFGLGGSLPLYAPGSLTDSSVLSAEGDAGIGIETSQNYTATLDTDRNKKFVQSYQAAYKALPTFSAVDAYDACLSLDQALAKGTTGDDLVAGLAGITAVESPRGDFKFGPDHNPVQNMYLLKVRKGANGPENAVVDTLPKAS